MADPKIDDRSDEMEHALHKLEDHIDDAKQGLAHSKEQAGAADGVAGEPTGEQNASGGEDPEGSDNDVEGEAQDDDGREPEEVASPT